MPRRFSDEDLFGEDEGAPSVAAPSTPAPPSPVRQSAAQRRAGAAAKARSTRSEISAATRKRRTWEATPEGQARSKDIQDFATEGYNDLVRKHPEQFPHGEIERTGLSKAQIYHTLGVTFEGHGRDEQQLPGMENPHAVGTPPAWEELPEKQRAKTEQNMRRFGTSIDQMTRDVGAQVDQSIWRAHMAGHTSTRPGQLIRREGDKEVRSSAVTQPVPFTKHFYDAHPADAPEPLDRPKEMMRESRRHLEGQGVDVDPMVHYGAVSHVSPNTKFTSGPRGERGSPNIEAAESVIEQHTAGTPPHEITSGTNRQGVTNTARPANMRRAARMMEQVEGGAPMGAARNQPSQTNPQGSTQWGAKTAAFTNSWDAQHPDFTVGDVHTFGGGTLPHHGVEKPLKRLPGGGLHRAVAFQNDPRNDKDLMADVGRNAFQADKSEREHAMEKIGTAIPGSEGKKVTGHAAVDYAMRQALRARGFSGSTVRQAQASQWGEEQIQRKTKNPRLDIPSHQEAYPDQGQGLNSSQFSFF